LTLPGLALSERGNPLAVYILSVFERSIDERVG
jgi:hypothetical protein